MPIPYAQLLEATIEHLEGLKAKGVRAVAVKQDTLSALRQPAARADKQPGAVAPRLERGENMTPAGVNTSSSRLAFAPETSREIRPVQTEPATVSRVVPALAPLSAQAKAEGMKELRERALICMKCPNLASSRKNVVFGVGDIQATLMFVGEAPGADEDAQGEPFVGAAGQLLTRIIQTMGLTREQVYIANILKCRPDTPGRTSGNRKPTLEEMRTCIPYLHSQIDLIQPRALVALGGTAVEGLLGQTEGITRLRGHWKEYRGIPLMPTFHPSYLLRNQALSEKRKVWEDMLQVMDRLEMPISEKQRGYFLRP
jgi:DNA polymerase